MSARLLAVSVLTALPPLALVACLDDGLDARAGEVREGTAEAIGLLRFLNGPQADLETLDVAAGLDARAARNIVAHVRGADGDLGTPDDDLLDSVAELDAIPQVGPATIAKLVAYVDSIGGVPRIEVEGVRMTEAEARSIVAAANGATLVELDDAAALDARAARGLVDTRPHADVFAVARVAYVGTAALEKLRVWAPGWSPPDGATCVPALRAGMRACVEVQVADGATTDEAIATCTDGEALGPVFDAICAGPLGAPFCGGSFEAFFTTYVPPCAVDLAYELMPLCTSDADCGGAPLRCWGRPGDESTAFGVCKDIRNVPGQGEPCTATRACGAGLVCAGLTRWDEGICVGTWMSDTFVMDVPQLVPAGAGLTSSSTVIAHGLATVPIDILVDVDVRGADPRRLRITLVSPAGDRGLVWDGATGGTVIPSRIRPGAPGIPSDDAVNGAWKLEVTTIGAGTAGTLHGWSVYLTSQWD